MSRAPVILYIEDNLDNRKLVVRLLGAFGYEVHTAVDGIQGLAYSRIHAPDLILLDLNMPGLDGYSVAQQMRQLDHLNHVPIIALTANIMKGNRERSLEAGCDGFISKPISVDTFPMQVQSFLDKGR
jgi:two-component system, cell cycle response regulator DivK